MQATRLSSGRGFANAKAAENASRLRAAFGLPKIQRRSMAKCSAQQLVGTRCSASYPVVKPDCSFLMQFKE